MNTDKIKDFIFVRMKKLIGSSLESFVFRIAIGLFSLWVGSATDVGDAVGIAMDKDRSLKAAIELINETPQPEVIEVVKEIKADKVTQ